MASISGGAGNGINRMLRKKYHVVRKKYHVVRKLFYVASIFGGAAGRRNRPPWELSSTASRRRQRLQCVYRAPVFSRGAHTSLADTNKILYTVHFTRFRILSIIFSALRPSLRLFHASSVNCLLIALPSPTLLSEALEQSCTVFKPLRRKQEGSPKPFPPACFEGSTCLLHCFLCGPQPSAAAACPVVSEGVWPYSAR